MAEVATSLYFDILGIRHTANIMTHVDGFNLSTYAAPDFVALINGTRRIVEVKSNQLHHNARYFRMLTPQHWLSYKKNKSLALWCATDIEKNQVHFYGFNDVEMDFTESQMTYVKTCVDNFQLNKTIECRHFGEANNDGW